MEILAANFESSAGYEVKKIKHLGYEVRNKEGSSFHGDISKKKIVVVLSSKSWRFLANMQ